jgi:hypothetical protein
MTLAKPLRLNFAPSPCSSTLELGLKLGVTVSQAAVAKYMVRCRRPPSQTWRAFLANHVTKIVAADYFAGP